MKADTLYLKLEQNVRIFRCPPRLGEIARILCAEKAVEDRVKKLEFPMEKPPGDGRFAFSVTDVIQVIQKEYPQLTVCSVGEPDFILTVERKKKAGKGWDWCKTFLVCLLSFFGAAFSIMAFNNDVGITQLFHQLYRQFTGEESGGFTVLEITYSLGVGLGILIYFNHFSRRKKTADPSPLEVKMRSYEKEVNAALLEEQGRKQEGGQ